MDSFEDKIAVITGRGPPGWGRELAVQLGGGGLSCCDV